MSRIPWRQLKAFLHEPLDLRTPAEVAFVETWLERRDHTAALVGLMIGVIFHVTAVLLAVFAFSAAILLPFVVVNGVAFALEVAWLLTRDRLPIDSRKTAWLISLLYPPAAMYVIHMALPSCTSDERIMLAAAMVIVCKTSLLVSPMRGIPIFATAGYYVVLGAVLLGFGGLGVLWLQVFVASMGFTVLFQNALVQMTKREAQRELRAREALAMAERAEITRELSLARQIQDSFRPPVDPAPGAGFAVNWYHEKHDQVGGDWLGLRALPDGGLAAVVADATGKGIQAALIIHALQALWADALHEPAFSAALWLERVNRTLLTLGAASSQTLTLGLAMVERGNLTYWSAGHVPLFLVPHEQKALSLVARGPLLGMAKELDLRPVSHLLLPGSAYTVLLGSDGVFPKGTLTRARDLARLIERIERGGEGMLTNREIEDDKTLVIIKKAG